MKVQFWCDNGANIHSKRYDIFDVEKDLSIAEEEWATLTEDEKYEIVKEWALEWFDYGWKEL